MYKTIYLTVLLGLFFFINGLSAQNGSLNLSGKWEDSQKMISYEFNPDSTIMFYQNGQGVLISSYTVDTSKDPMWIDFTIKLGNQSMNIMSLLKTIDSNTMWIEQGSSFGEHPTEFSDIKTDGKHKIHVLKKVPTE